MIISAKRVIYGGTSVKPDDNSVRICDGKITDIGAACYLKRRYPDDETVFFEDGTLMPSLVDAHTHLGLDGASSLKIEDENVFYENAVKRLNQALLNGVTAVRDVGSPAGAAVKVRRLAKEMKLEIPEIYSSGRALVSTGGHCYGLELTETCDGADAVRSAVEQRKAEGVDLIKVMDSQAWRGQEYSQEELNAAVETAHSLGLPATIHAGAQPSVTMAIEAGFDSIEHGTFITMENVKKLKGYGGTLVPTVLAFAELYRQTSQGFEYNGSSDNSYGEAAVKQYEKNIRSIYESGLRLACGTDMVLPYDMPLPVAREAACLVGYGVPEIAAIEAATKNSSYLIGKSRRSGEIREGYEANLMVVCGNPLEDIKALEQVQAVWFAGKRIR